jgi:hypothetical protein
MKRIFPGETLEIKPSDLTQTPVNLSLNWFHFP